MSANLAQLRRQGQSLRAVLSTLVTSTNQEEMAEILNELSKPRFVSVHVPIPEQLQNDLKDALLQAGVSITDFFTELLRRKQHSLLLVVYPDSPDKKKRAVLLEKEKHPETKMPDRKRHPSFAWKPPAVVEQDPPPPQAKISGGDEDNCLLSADEAEVVSEAMNTPREQSPQLKKLLSRRTRDPELSEEETARRVSLPGDYLLEDIPSLGDWLDSSLVTSALKAREQVYQLWEDKHRELRQNVEAATKKYSATKKPADGVVVRRATRDLQEFAQTIRLSQRFTLLKRFGAE